MKNICIEVNDIHKSYGSGEYSLEALKGVSFTIESGSFVSIVGRSGSGKSTLLYIMAALDTPTSGYVCIDNIVTSDMNNNQKCSLRNEKIGFIFQSFYLEENYTVYKNIEMPLIIGGIALKQRRMLVEEAAQSVGLSSKLKNKAANLSGGEKKRVAIARAIVRKPSIIFADEPCGNLDTENGSSIMNLLRSLVRQGITVVLVTHNMDDAKKLSVSYLYVTDWW